MKMTGVLKQKTVTKRLTETLTKTLTKWSKTGHFGFLYRKV